MQTQTIVQNTTGASTPSDTDNNWSVAVDSMGSAGIALVSALKNGLKIGQQEIARRLLHAPSVLADNLSPQSAQQIADYLSEIGLEARALGPDENFESGVGGYEVAIVDMDYSRAADVLKLLVELTGIPADNAVKLLSKSPAVVLANISQANANVLQQRFAGVGAQLAISELEQATYDVLLMSNNFASQRELLQLVKTLRLPNGNEQHAQNEAVAIQGLNYQQAQELWQAAQERRINCKLLDRAYQRYDIRLEKVDNEQREQVAQYLVKQCGIPEKVIGKVLQRLPMGIASGKELAEAYALVESLHGLGAVAVADLTATLNFDLDIDNLKRPDKVEELLVLIGGLAKTHLEKFFKGKTTRINGPVNYAQARWLQHEITKLGCKVSIQKRG